MQGVLVHYACPWEMPDEKKPGTFRRGYSLQFVAPYEETREGAVGFRGTKTSISDESVFLELTKLGLPVLCDLVLTAKPGPDGKLTAVVAGIQNAKRVKMFELA